MPLALLMDYEYNGLNLRAGYDRVLVRSDAGATPWAKQVIKYDGKEFVMCPEEQVIGFETE